MAEGFLRRYSDELTALRRRAARFAESHPKIAGRLRLSGDTADDPHVERLVQSFAFVAARVRQKLDDEFPELTGSMLETLYPHYLAPVPSAFVARLSPVAGLDSVQVLPRHAEIAAEPVENERCRFRTAWDADLAPVVLDEARLAAQPVEAPLAPQWRAASVLRLSVRPEGNTGLADLGLSRLRLHLAGSFEEAAALHELIATQTLGIALARHAGDAAPLRLPASAIRAVGFDEAEALLPTPAASFSGYRLLSEFFALPKKFLFLDITGLDGWREDALEIFVYLARSDERLERAVSARSFALNAVPVVNLFRQRAEPVVVDGTRTEYALVPDARRHRTREIHGVESVFLTDEAGNRERAPHFFEGGGGAVPSWQVARRFDPLDGTSDVTIAFAGAHGAPVSGGERVASIDTLCLNRDLPERLPFGGGHPRLDFADPAASVAAVEALDAPSRPLRFEGEEERHWRLVSHLNLNHLSLTDENGAALKEMLRLYTRADRREANRLIEAICGIASISALSRVSGGGMVPGTDIRLTFDPARIERGAAYLFASVLDRFFGLYTSINAFTRLTAEMKGQAEPVARFPARLAERPLL